MRITKKCQKCGALSDVEAEDQHAACSGCGAVFSKVEAAGTSRSAGRTSASFPSSGYRESGMNDSPGTVSGKSFLTELREATNYPTFRGVVNLVYWFWIALAAMTAVGTVVGLFVRDGRLMTLIVGTVLTLFFVFVGRLLKETAMMLADLSDATIFTAKNAK